MDSAINGLLQSLDPYSAYMSPKSFKGMQTDTKGEFGGLGIEIGMESGVIKVISPIDDTPAANTGIKASDYIVRINGEQVQGKSLTEAVELMRGPVGSSIKLTIRRKNVKKALDFKITRAIIEVKSVEKLKESIFVRPMQVTFTQKVSSSYSDGSDYFFWDEKGDINKYSKTPLWSYFLNSIK